MKKRGIIFDFNGTLFYDSPMHVEVFKRICKDYDIPEYSEEYVIEKIFGRSNRDIILDNYKADATEEDIAYFEELKEGKYRDLCLERRDEFHFADGAAEFLDYIKERGIPYAIATSSPLSNMDFYFEHMGLDRWFTYDNITYDDGTLVCKPAPDVYLRTSEKLGLVPEECIVFEDSEVGILAANNARIKDVFALVPDGKASPVTDQMSVAGVIPDFTGYKEIINKYF